MQISLKPLGPVSPAVMEKLGDKLGGAFGCPVVVKAGIPELNEAYDFKRRQYASAIFLGMLADHKKQEEKVIGITEVDTFAPGLSFVFGEADPINEVAVVSLMRLKPEFYQAAANDDLFLARALKEMMHEMGHVFGLIHCSNPGCVMHFSNCLADTDLKGAAFCSFCRPRLKL